MTIIKEAEKDLQQRLIKYFSKWFYVYSEVRSLCKKKRIDLILVHHSDTDGLFQIGIEIKKIDTMQGHALANWCLQAKEYSNLIFKEKKAVIFVTPQISGLYLDEGENVKKHNVQLKGFLGYHNNTNSFLYKCFGFGELQKYDGQFLRFVINTNQIWSSENPTFFDTIKLSKCK